MSQDVYDSKTGVGHGPWEDIVPHISWFSLSIYFTLSSHLYARFKTGGWEVIKSGIWSPNHIPVSVVLLDGKQLSYFSKSNHNGVGRVLLVRWNLEGVQGPQRFPSCRLKSTHFLTVCLILSPISGWNNDALSGGAENAMPTRLHRKSHCSSWLWPWRGDWSSFSDLQKTFLKSTSRPTSKYLLKIPTTWSNQLRATEGRSMQLDFWSVDFFYGGENGRIFQIHVHPFPTGQNDFPPFSILIKPKKTSQELQKMSLVTLDWKCHPKSYNLSIWWEHKCGISCQTNLIRNGNAVFKTGLFVQLDVKTFSEGTECSFDKTFAWKIQDHLLSFKWKSSGKSRMWFCGERPGSFVDKPVRATSVSPNWKTGKFAKNKNLMDVKWSISIPLWNVPPGANFVEAGPEELEGDRHRSLLHRCHPLHRCSQVPPHQPSKMNFNICGNFFHGQNFICTHA